MGLIAEKRPTYLRLSQIVAPNGILPIGRSTWLAGVASGRFPRPIKLSPGLTLWRVADIDALLEECAKAASPHDPKEWRH